MQAPLPPDEWARVEAVRALGLLDTHADERFDRITRTARAAFGVPISYVSLVEEGRQWMLSCVGLEQGSSLDRADSICAHAIAAGETLVVPDARTDPRFADNPAVTGPPHVVFYAGHPLRDPLTRHLVGTLCLIDVVPRGLDPDEHTRLDDLAGWVEAELARTHLARMVERSELERATVARLSAERARLLDALAEGVVAVDGQGRVTSVNAAFVELLGHPPSSVVGVRLHDVAHGTRRDGTVHPWEECTLRATLADGRSRRVAGDVFTRADGQLVPMDVVVAPIVEQDEVVGAVMTLLDATERMETERDRRELLATVSHEMRTPLTSIRGAFELLQAGAVGDLPDRAGRIVEIGLSGTDRLIRLVGDLVDAERWEQGAGGLARGPRALRTVVDSAVDGVRVLADRAGIELDVDVPDVEVLVDADRVVQVLVNLLGNAVKFSDRGDRVSVRAMRVGAGVQVDVIDEGRGIPADKLASVFGRFEQVDPGAPAERLGFGLGLGIARAIVEVHGGRIWVDSREGEGTSFHFTLRDTSELRGQAALVTVEGVTVAPLVEALRAVPALVTPGLTGSGPAASVVAVLGEGGSRAGLLDEVLRAEGLRVTCPRTTEGVIDLARHQTISALVVAAGSDPSPAEIVDLLGANRPRVVLMHGPDAGVADLQALGAEVEVLLPPDRAPD